MGAAQVGSGMATARFGPQYALACALVAVAMVVVLAAEPVGDASLLRWRIPCHCDAWLPRAPNIRQLSPIRLSIRFSRLAAVEVAARRLVSRASTGDCVRRRTCLPTRVSVRLGALLSGGRASGVRASDVAHRSGGRAAVAAQETTVVVVASGVGGGSGTSEVISPSRLYRGACPRGRV
jgi:hypothetical protein